MSARLCRLATNCANVSVRSIRVGSTCPCSQSPKIGWRKATRLWLDRQAWRLGTLRGQFFEVTFEEHVSNRGPLAHGQSDGHHRLCQAGSEQDGVLRCCMSSPRTFHLGIRCASRNQCSRTLEQALVQETTRRSPPALSSELAGLRSQDSRTLRLMLTDSCEWFAWPRNRVNQHFERGGAVCVWRESGERDNTKITKISRGLVNGAVVQRGSYGTETA